MDELSEESRKMFVTLAQKLKEEEQFIINLTQLQGSMQMILSGAEMIPAIKETQNLEPSSNATQLERNLVLNRI